MRRCAVAVILALGVWIAPVALAHPDLLAQIEHLDEQLRAKPGNAELLMRRGDLYRRHEDYAAAARDFTAARRLAPELAELDFHQGRLALEAGDLETAAAFLDRHLADRPNDPVGWRLRGETALRRGEVTAPGAFERAVRFSDQPSPDLYRQWVLAWLVLGDRSAALEAVDRALARLEVEVTLTGLGTDIALAERDAARAGDYLARLPPRLRTLTPWAERVGAVACLEAQAPGQAADPGQCVTGAIRRLDTQLAHTR